MIAAALVFATACALAVLASAGESQRRAALFIGSATFTALRYDNRLHGWPTVIVLLGVLWAVRPRRSDVSGGANRYQRLALILAAAASITMIWSPRPIEAFQTVGNWVALALAIAVVKLAMSRRGDVLAIAYGLLIPLGLLAATVIVFRFSPDLERTYYLSRISTIFLGNTGNAIYEGSILTTNNAVELERAAGYLFVNVNRASMALGVGATLMLALGLKYDARGLRRGALLLGLAVVATGSKTGLVLLLAACVAVGAARLTARLGGRGATYLVTIGAGIAVAAAVRTAIQANGEFIQESRTTLQPRQELWGEIWRAITENPVLGLGFGGWMDRWRHGDVVVLFRSAMRPAHNWFLQSWLDGGLLYMIPNAVLAILIVASVVQAYRSVANGGPTWRLLATFPGAWIVIHGMGDNSPLYGDTATIIPLALALTIASNLGSAVQTDRIASGQPTQKIG